MMSVRKYETNNIYIQVQRENVYGLTYPVFNTKNNLNIGKIYFNPQKKCFAFKPAYNENFSKNVLVDMVKFIKSLEDER